MNAAVQARLPVGDLDVVPIRPEPIAAPRRWDLRAKFRVFIVLPVVIGIAGTAASGLLFVHYSMTFPDPLSLRLKERAPVIKILGADGSILAERGTPHDYMPLDLLPRHITDAVVATEDRRFFEHNGLDPYGLVRAVFANLRAGRYAQGGSTVTQQLAKNLFLNSERTLSRKVEELALSLWLEMRLSKSDILELYLNRVYFGAGAYGIEAAAQRYFDKSARALSLDEAAVIAGLLKAPSKFSPLQNPGAARARARVVLKKMLAAGLISADAEAKAARTSVRFAGLKPNRDHQGVEYAIDHILERMPPLLGNGHAEVIVETTIDARLQRRAQATVERVLARDGEAGQASQASVVVLDVDGGIAALVGGRSFAESQFNRAVKSKRQPGSTFKPFVYLAALEAGLTPDTIVQDLPVTIGGWSPRNDGGLYRGAVSVRQGLSQSINTVAVRLQHEIGVKRVAATAQRLGISSELRTDASLALGTSEVSLMELTGAYTAFANSGRRVEPHIIKRVRISSGRVLYMRPQPASQIVIAPGHVGAMNEMLNAALVAGTGRRAAMLNHPAAGKTGTTQDFRDAWFIGYTAHLAGGVWVGNDQGRAMNNVRGGSLPALIWREIMTAAHEGRSVMALPGTKPADPKLGETPMAQAPEARLQTSARPRDDQAARAPMPMVVPMGAPLAATAPTHQRERADQAALAKLLELDRPAPTQLVPRPVPSAAPISPVPNTDTAAAQPDGRLQRFAPPGMMSLGRKQP